MTVKTERKPGESFDEMLKRFSRKVFQSKVLVLAKKKRFYQPKKSELEIKQDATRKKDAGEKKKVLEKMGITKQFNRKK